MSRKASKGAALITALFITALAAIIATSIAVHQRLLVSNAETLMGYDQMKLYLQGLQYWAKAEIEASVDANGVSNGILKHDTFPEKTIDGYHLKARVVDQQGLFNVNVLAQTEYQPNFARLLSVLNIQNQKALPGNISDWMQSQQTNDEAYLKLTPSYLPGHRPFANRTELRAVLGVTQSLYQKLAPYVTALPTNKLSVNVNTAPAAVLAAVMPELGLSAADSIVSCRESTGGIANWQVLSECAPSLNQLSSKEQHLLSYNSRYFMVYGHVRYQGRQLNLTSLLYLVPADSDDSPVRVDVLWQAFE